VVKNGAAQEERETAGDAGLRRSGPMEMRKEGKEEKMCHGRKGRPTAGFGPNRRGEGRVMKNTFPNFLFYFPFSFSNRIQI